MHAIKETLTPSRFTGKILINYSVQNMVSRLKSKEKAKTESNEN